MMAVAMTLKDYLDSSDVHYELVQQPYAPTSPQLANMVSVSGENLAKAVVLRDGDSLFLAVVPATHHVQLAKLRRHFNRYIVLASEQQLPDLLHDCGVGAAPAPAPAPAPVIDSTYGVDVIFDNCLYEREDIYFEAGDHTDLIHVTGKDFRGLMSRASHGEISQHN